MLVQILLGVGGFVATGVVGLLVWSMKRNAASLDKSIGRVEAAVAAIATDVRQLSATVGSHAGRLEAGNVRFDEMERRHTERVATLQGRIDGMEERERKRCNECHLRARPTGRRSTDGG
jgi:hypothetical protein